MLVVIAEKEELKLVDELGYKDYPVVITGVDSVIKEYFKEYTDE